MPHIEIYANVNVASGLNIFFCGNCLCYMCFFCIFSYTLVSYHKIFHLQQNSGKIFENLWGPQHLLQGILIVILIVDNTLVISFSITYDKSQITNPYVFILVKLDDCA